MIGFGKFFHDMMFTTKFCLQKKIIRTFTSGNNFASRTIENDDASVVAAGRHVARLPIDIETGDAGNGGGMQSREGVPRNKFVQSRTVDEFGRRFFPSFFALICQFLNKDALKMRQSERLNARLLSV